MNSEECSQLEEYMSISHMPQIDCQLCASNQLHVSHVMWDCREDVESSGANGDSGDKYYEGGGDIQEELVNRVCRKVVDSRLECVRCDADQDADVIQSESFACVETKSSKSVKRKFEEVFVDLSCERIVTKFRKKTRLWPLFPECGEDQRPNLSNLSNLSQLVPDMKWENSGSHGILDRQGTISEEMSNSNRGPQILTLGVNSGEEYCEKSTQKIRNGIGVVGGSTVGESNSKDS